MQWLWRLLGTPPWAAEIITNQEAIMATQAELDAAVNDLDLTLDLVAAGVSAQAANTDALEAEIVKLQEQLDAGHTAIDLTGVLRVKNEAKIIADTFAKVIDPGVENPAPGEFVEPVVPVDVPETADEEADTTTSDATEDVATEPEAATDPVSAFPTSTNDDGTTTL